MEQNFKNELKEKELVVRDHNRLAKVNESLQRKIEENEIKIQQLVAKGTLFNYLFRSLQLK
jgi:hypothetical protein